MFLFQFALFFELLDNAGFLRKERMTDLTIAQFILVLVMGKENESLGATRELNFGSTLIFNGGTTQRN